MKKRFLLPCLLLVGSLSACGGASGGLVKGGRAYREGDAAAVNPALKAQKDGSVKAVTVNEKVTLKMDLSYGSQKATMSETANAKIKVDFSNKKLDGEMKISVKSNGQSQNVNISFDAQERNGQIVVNTYGEYASAITDDVVEAYYMSAKYEIYSWNYSINSQELGKLLEELDSTSGASATAFVKDLYNNTVISGDVENGNFEVGLGKPITLRLSGIDMKFNKLKYTYKDCLLKSAVIGMSADGASSGVGYKISEEASINYSYTF